jgi:hypothetical protein
MTPAPLGVEGLDVGADPSRERVQLSGVVTDLATEAPLVGATVSFPFGSGRWVVLTDADGAFRIGGIEPGVQWVQAKHLGYEGAAVSVVAGAANAHPVKLRLRPDSALLVGVARIDAGRESERRATAHMTVRHVDRERIAAHPGGGIRRSCSGPPASRSCHARTRSPTAGPACRGAAIRPA